MIQQYADALVLAGKTEHVHQRLLADRGRAIDHFIEAMGDLSVTRIGAEEVRTFATLLSQAKAKGQEKPLATSTVRLIIARLSSVLSYPVDAGAIQANPVSSSRIHKRLGLAKLKRRLNDDRGYSWSELVKMFCQPDFAAFRYAEGRPGNTPFWLPLMAAYTGARREEIAQLYVGDVRQELPRPVREDPQKPT